MIPPCDRGPAGRAVPPLDESRHRHAEAERTMKELESLDADEPGSDLLIGELVTGLRSHIRDEEDYLFPRLRQTASEDARMKRGDQVRRVKKTAPTRPHPSAPDNPAPPGVSRWWVGLWPAPGRHGNGLSGRRTGWGGGCSAQSGKRCLRSWLRGTREFVLRTEGARPAGIPFSLPAAVSFGGQGRTPARRTSDRHGSGRARYLAPGPVLNPAFRSDPRAH
ncbi:hemerythrin domain-containing protein [Streptomyces sp. NPDC091209]|uniref:hemerythrin domain-containing protein n=1 Tax=Streptomyces sp. NPDC091209 TaxID=3365974 RepID=UPI0038176A85